MNRSHWIVVALVVVAIACGALREFLFLNLNYQIDHVARHTPFSYAHSTFQGWTTGASLRTLVVLKWTLSFLFIAVNWGLCLLVLRALFGHRRYARAVTGLIVAIGALALLLHLLAPSFDGLEDVSVRLLHAIQYPVLLLVIVAARGLAPRQGVPGS